MFTSINSRYNIMDTNTKIIKASGNINWRSSSKTSKFKKECRRGSHRSTEGVLSVSARLGQYLRSYWIIWEWCNQGVIKLYSRRGNTKACLKDLITVMNYNCHIILHKNHYNFWIRGNSTIFLTEMKIKEIRTTIKVKIASLSTIEIIDVIEEVKNEIEANEIKSVTWSFLKLQIISSS